MEKKSLKDFQTYNEEKFSKQILYKNNGHVDFLLNFQPGQDLPPHKHPGMTVYLLVLEGNGVLTTDDKDTEIAKNDLICVSEDELLSLKNSSDQPLSLYVNLKKN